VVSLYLDAHVDALAARRLRRRGYDIIAAHEVGMADASDAEHLAYAAAHGRALVTYNVRDFAPLYHEWWQQRRHHAGIIVSREYQRPEIGELLRLLEQVFLLATEEDLADRLRYLSEFDV
jgi:predicted nuclease of predicted toxin-antitoxin system